MEIAYFDRGPISNEEMVSGGYWSTYWYNGFIYGAELPRGFDVFRLLPSEHLSQNEIDAAAQVRMAQLQQTALDLERDSRVSAVGERPTERSRMRSLAATLRGVAGSMP